MNQSRVSTYASAIGQIIITLALMFNFAWEVAHNQPVDPVTTGLLGTLVGFYFYDGMTTRVSTTTQALLNATPPSQQSQSPVSNNP